MCRRSRATLLLLVSCGYWLSACGTPAAGAAMLADAGPIAVVTSEGKLLQLQAYTAPSQPPTRGLSTVSLEISDATSGQPQDGLTINAVPWMPAHGHGTSIKPVVAAKGGGVYEISKVNMFMGGKWDLRLTFSGAISDRVTLHFSIP